MVIIQGLLIHKGRGPNPTPAGFDGSDYLIKNTENALLHGYKVRYLCWEDKISDLPFKIKKYCDENSNFTIESVIDEYKHKQDTKIKMLGSFYKSIKEDTNLDSNTIIIRIRSDMLMPESFWHWIKKSLLSNIVVNNKLYVSELNNLTGYVGDFVMIATKAKFEKEIHKYICKSQIDLHPGNSDIGLKIMSDNLESLNIITRKATRQNWTKYVEENLSTLPKMVLSEIVWKNKRMDQVLEIDMFTYPTGDANRIYRLEDFKSLIYLYKIYRERDFKENRILNILLYVSSMIDVIKAITRKISNFNPLNRKKIFSRVACFGRIVIEDRNIIRNSRVYNFQKGRIDYINQLLGDRNIDYESAGEVNAIISDSELQEFQKQNILLKTFDFKDVDVFLMDTFSDLTDRKFQKTQSHRFFLSHYGDLDKSSEDFINVEDLGLLPLEQLASEYQTFIETIIAFNPKSKIIFIHYPTKFEKRIEYVQRAEAIAKILLEISKNHGNVRNIILSESQVLSKDHFPYHYAEETNQILKYELNNLLN